MGAWLYLGSLYMRPQFQVHSEYIVVKALSDIYMFTFYWAFEKTFSFVDSNVMSYGVLVLKELSWRIEVLPCK